VADAPRSFALAASDFLSSKDAVMCRLFALSLVASLLGLSSGCAICCAPFDCDYPIMGGRWTRMNPSSGRVGSAFDEAGAPSGIEQASANETSPQPTRESPPTPSRTIPAQPVQPSPLQQTPQPYRYQTRMYGPPQGQMPPASRPVIPRDMGNTYLPNGE